MTFTAQLAADAAAVQRRLNAALAGYSDQPVVQAMRYAVQGGKRLRGFLVMESARLHDVSGAALGASP